MMDLKTVVNSVGLILNALGVYMVYVNSPINLHTIDGNDSDIEKETERKNNLLKIGVWVVIVGSVLQLVSNYIPSKN